MSVLLAESKQGIRIVRELDRLVATCGACQEDSLDAIDMVNVWTCRSCSASYEFSANHPFRTRVRFLDMDGGMPSQLRIDIVRGWLSKWLEVSYTDIDFVVEFES